MNTTEKLAEALREIAGAHIPDMPCAVNDPEGWRERHFNRLRHIARAALAAHDAEQAQRQPLIARARDEWHLDDGPVMWWGWSGDSLGWIGEPAWIGTPLDDDWPGYHTHWTPHPAMPAGATTGKGPDHAG